MSTDTFPHVLPLSERSADLIKDTAQLMGIQSRSVFFEAYKKDGGTEWINTADVAYKCYQEDGSYDDLVENFCLDQWKVWQSFFDPGEKDESDSLEKGGLE